MPFPFNKRCDWLGLARVAESGGAIVGRCNQIKPIGRPTQERILGIWPGCGAVFARTHRPGTRDWRAPRTGCRDLI